MNTTNPNTAVISEGLSAILVDVMATADPATRYHRALSAFSAGALSEEDYRALVDTLDQWEPVTPIELLQKFVAMCAGGIIPGEDRIRLLLEQAIALLGDGQEG